MELPFYQQEFTALLREFGDSALQAMMIEAQGAVVSELLPI